MVLREFLSEREAIHVNIYAIQKGGRVGKENDIVIVPKKRHKIFPD